MSKAPSSSHLEEEGVLLGAFCSSAQKRGKFCPKLGSGEIVGS